MRAFLLLLCRQAGLLDDHKLARKVEFDFPSVASLAVWRERRGPGGKVAGVEEEFENGKKCLGCGMVPISLDHESSHRRHQSTNKRGDKGEVAGTSVGGRELRERREWSPLEKRGFNIRPQSQSQFDSQQLVSLTIFRLYNCLY
jgi:hypothetical protein